MLFCTGGYVACSGDVEYIHFNLPGLYSKTGSTNSNIYCLTLATNISNFLHGVQYLLFEIVLRKITLLRGLNLCFHTPFLVLATASICNINKIAYTILQGDVRCTFVTDYLSANMRTINKPYYVLQFYYYNKTKCTLFIDAFH